jgi:hypothetical protein
MNGVARQSPGRLAYTTIPNQTTRFQRGSTAWGTFGCGSWLHGQGSSHDIRMPLKLSRDVPLYL